MYLGAQRLEDLEVLAKRYEEEPRKSVVGLQAIWIVIGHIESKDKIYEPHVQNEIVSSKLAKA